MLELILAKPNQAVVAAEAVTSRLLPGWMLRLWRAAVLHAERPDRFVPYC